MRITLQEVKDRSNVNGEQGFWYLATPYTHPDSTRRTSRAEDARQISGWLMGNGIFNYSPIWSCHLISQERKLAHDYHWWRSFNRSFIRASIGIIACQMEGWTGSEGMAHEIHDEAVELNRPVIYLHFKQQKDAEIETYIDRWDDEHPIVL